jgi:hypothetical protein
MSRLNNPGALTCGHPERPWHAKGMCEKCYMKDYDANRRKRKDPSEYSENYRKPPKNSRGKSIPTCGHPERRYAAWGKCSSCYQAARRSGEIIVGMAQCHPEKPALAKGMCYECYSKSRYWNDPEKMQAIARERGTAARKELRDELLAAYGGKCACLKCPETNSDFLTLEHINGGGKEHREKVGSHAYADLRRRGFPQDGYTLLCWNCNTGSRFTGICPHMVVPT